MNDKPIAAVGRCDKDGNPIDESGNIMEGFAPTCTCISLTKIQRLVITKINNPKILQIINTLRDELNYKMDGWFKTNNKTTTELCKIIKTQLPLTIYSVAIWKHEELSRDISITQLMDRLNKAGIETEIITK